MEMLPPEIFAVEVVAMEAVALEMSAAESSPMGDSIAGSSSRTSRSVGVTFPIPFYRARAQFAPSPLLCIPIYLSDGADHNLIDDSRESDGNRENEGFVGRRGGSMRRKLRSIGADNKESRPGNLISLGEESFFCAHRKFLQGASNDSSARIRPAR
jgi:hypothetical protein